MPYEEEKTDCEHRRSLRLALDFLDAYHPVSGERMSLVNGLRDQLRKATQHRLTSSPWQTPWQQRPSLCAGES